jgi:L-ribulokinase
LSTDVVVSIGAFDCHMGAVGAQIAPNTFVRVVGTSTCDIMVSSYNEMEGCIIPGICGQVDGSVLPEMVGLEAGQSAFGDVYAWFKRVLAWPIECVIASSTLLDEATKAKLVEEAIDSIIPLIALEAEKVPAGSLSVFATDWMNGRRTPDANQLVKGTITGLTLATTAPQLFRALVEATAFGSKAIVDRFIENGIKIDSVIAIGGISQKSPLVMQILADVLNMPIKVAKCEQACALGAAMFAATAAGVYSSILDAQAAMGQGFSKVYSPNPHNAEVYKSCYNRYKLLGDTTEASFFSNQ